MRRTTLVSFQNRDIPTDILFYICEFLNIIPEVFRLHRVCKSWRHFFVYTFNLQVQHIFFPFDSYIFAYLERAILQFPQLKSCTICVDPRNDFYSILVLLKMLRHDFERIHFIFSGCFPQGKHPKLKFTAQISFNCCNSQILSHFSAEQKLKTNYYFISEGESTIPTNLEAKSIIEQPPSMDLLQELYTPFLKQYHLCLHQIYYDNQCLDLCSLVTSGVMHFLWQYASYEFTFENCEDCFKFLIENIEFLEDDMRYHIKACFLSTCKQLGYQFELMHLNSLESFDYWFINDLLEYNLIDLYSSDKHPIVLFWSKPYAIAMIAKHSSALQLCMGDSLGCIQNKTNLFEFRPLFFLMKNARNFQDIAGFDLLIKRGNIDLDERDIMGRTIAYYVMKQENKLLIDYLVRAGKSNLILDRNYDVSPIKFGLKLSTNLLQHLNDILPISIFDFCFSNNENLLMCCLQDSFNWDKDLITFLLQHCNLNWCNCNGANALFYAAYPFHIDLLIRSDINLHHRNADGETPLLFYLKHNQINVALQFLHYYPSCLDNSALQYLVEFLLNAQSVLSSSYHNFYFKWNYDFHTCILLEILGRIGLCLVKLQKIISLSY